MGDVGFPCSGKEKKLWEERSHLESKITAREKMAHNVRERLKDNMALTEAVELKQEEREAEAQIRRLRAKISKVDRKIRSAEAEGLQAPEDDEDGREVEEVKEVARQCMQFAYELGQARRRVEKDTQMIRILEAALKKAGGAELGSTKGCSALDPRTQHSGWSIVEGDLQ